MILSQKIGMFPQVKTYIIKKEKNQAVIIEQY